MDYLKDNWKIFSAIVAGIVLILVLIAVANGGNDMQMENSYTPSQAPITSTESNPYYPLAPGQ